MYDFYMSLKESALNWASSLGFAAGTEWLTAALVMASLFVFLRLLRWIFVRICLGLEDKQRYDFFDAMADFIGRFGYGSALYIAFYFGSLFVVLPEWFERMLNQITIVAVVVYLIFALGRLFVNLFKVGYHFQKKDSEINQTAVTFFRVVVEGILWIIGVIIVLQGWGYDVSVLLGGLGVVGIIISFSFQNVLKDIFAFFSIYTGKAFRIGDYIKSDSEKVAGTVTEIGLRATKIRAIGGHEVVVSNRLLVDGVVENFGMIKRRTVVMPLKVSFKTSVKELERIDQQIKKYFETEEEFVENKLVELKRAYMNNIDDVGFNFEVVYEISSADFDTYVMIKEKVYLDIVKMLEKEGVELAGRGKIELSQ